MRQKISLFALWDSRKNHKILKIVLKNNNSCKKMHVKKELSVPKNAKKNIAAAESLCVIIQVFIYCIYKCKW